MPVSPSVCDRMKIILGIGGLHTWPLLTKCRSGRDKRRAGLGRLQLSVPAATHRTGIWPLPHRSEKCEACPYYGRFSWFRGVALVGAMPPRSAKGEKKMFQRLRTLRTAGPAPSSPTASATYCATPDFYDCGPHLYPVRGPFRLGRILLTCGPFRWEYWRPASLRGELAQFSDSRWPRGKSHTDHNRERKAGPARFGVSVVLRRPVS